MTHGSTELATDFRPADCWQVRFWRVLLFPMRRSSPDHEPLYHLVRKWYLELDDCGVPVREIGLDSKARPLFRAPDGRNHGFWTDSTEAFRDGPLTPIAAEEFERVWESVSVPK